MELYGKQGDTVYEERDSVLSASNRRGGNLQAIEMRPAGSGEVSSAPRSPEKVSKAVGTGTGF